MDCPHLREYVSDARATDSDSVVLSIYCPDCTETRHEEEVGSLARAIAQDIMDAEDAAESLREIGRVA